MTAITAYAGGTRTDVGGHMDDLAVLSVGAPLPQPMLDLPGLTWVSPGSFLLILPRDDSEAIEAVTRAGRLLFSLGAADATPVMNFLVVDETGNVTLFVQAPRPWMNGKAAPESLATDGEPFVWTLIVSLGAEGYDRPPVQGSQELTVDHLLLLQTPAAITDLLRRIVDVQVEEGPISPAQRDELLAEYYGRAGDPQSALDDSPVTCEAIRVA
jgi:hypothetical protein